jgi:hypothetical protein
MVAINIALQRGMVPRLTPTMLGANYAQIAQNCDITAGRLDPLMDHQTIATTTLAHVTTLSHYNEQGVTGLMTWDAEVDVAKSPTSGDTLGRVFFTGDGEPRMTTLVDGIQGFVGRLPHAWFVLGVVAPKTAPTVTPTGGSGAMESRAYRWCWVTQYDEQGPLSDATVANGHVDASWDIAGLDPAPKNSGAIANAVSVGGVVTLDLDNSYGIVVGERIKVAGTAGIAGLNATHTVIEVTSAGLVRIKLAGGGAYAGGTWQREAPHNLVGLKRRIWRTTGTDTTYRMVDEIPAATLTYSDTVASTELFIAAPDVEALAPPKDLHGLVNMPNGCLAGISGNQLCFSEPFKPHSWPTDYRHNFAATLMKLVVCGANLVVLTDSFPYYVVTSQPGVIAPNKMATRAPCVSRAGACDAGGYAVYPSHDGIYAADSSGVRNLTAQLFRAKEWAPLSPEAFVAVVHNNKYMARHPNIARDDSVLMLDLAEPDSVVDVLSAPDAFHSSAVTGDLLATFGSDIRKWGGSASRRFQMLWCSKLYTFPGGAENFGAAQVRAQYQTVDAADVTASNAAIVAEGIELLGGSIGADSILVLEINGSRLIVPAAKADNAVTFSLIGADGEILWSRPIRNDEPFRLPAGFMVDAIAAQVSATFPIDAMAFATTTNELARVNI